MKCSKCGRRLDGIFLEYMPANGWICAECSENPRDPLFCRQGDHVKFAFPENGMDYDKELAKAYLCVGETYTVEEIHVGRSRAEIWLAEVPDTSFNSVLFERVGVADD